MRILSLYLGHDSSMCLLDDGEPVAVLEKERASRRKHDHGWPDLGVLLERYGWEPSSIDAVAVNPFVRLTADRFDRCGFELSGEVYIDRPDYLTPGLTSTVERRFSEHTIRLLGRSLPCVAVDHHLAHIACGFYTSPFRQADVMSVDGGGDRRTIACARGEGERITQLQYGWGTGLAGDEANIGRTWSSAGVHHFGYGSHEAAGKLMGLAPYGKARPELVEQFRAQAYSKVFQPLRGVPYPGPLNDRDTTAQDIAASLQAFTTAEYLRGAEALSRRLAGDALVLTGGCSMNCVANSAVHTSGIYGDTWVPAQPSDGGLALGQALFLWHHVLGHPRQPRAFSPYLGNDVGALDDQTIGSVVAELGEGRLVGVCAGSAETGPRALGHRSILADPRDPSVKDRINTRVKRREWYRPFAPMVLAEDFGRHFGPDVPSRYMSYVTQVSSDYLPGITHVDGSTRPQVVGPEDTLARRLLVEWKERSGIGVLLNTSFNAQEPLVDSVADAIDTWKKTDLDCVAVPGDFLIK